MNMKVHVRLYANLRQYSPRSEGSFDLNLPFGSAMKNLTEALDIPPSVGLVMLVNGRRATAETRLAPLDTVTLFPPMEGG
jgi:molybdopterin converting factor small subunit